MTAAAAVLAGAVRGYQLILRPLIGENCRFHPSCSAYAIAALNTHGAARGGLMAARRVLRCNPWHQGGYDPVPARPAQACADCNPHGKGHLAR